MLIPEDKQQDVLDVMWVLLSSAESYCSDKDVIARLDVEGAFRILRDIGYTKHYPRWENK